MINAHITHPTVLEALAAAGHKARILITDGYFAARTTVGRNASVVHLNFEPGFPTIPRVTELVSEMIPIELRTMMVLPDGGTSETQEQIDRALGARVSQDFLEREDFYSAARSDDLVLCIVTGDMRRFGNVILTVGVGME